MTDPIIHLTLPERETISAKMIITNINVRRVLRGERDGARVYLADIDELQLIDSWQPIEPAARESILRVEAWLAPPAAPGAQEVEPLSISPCDRRTLDLVRRLMGATDFEITRVLAVQTRADVEMGVDWGVDPNLAGAMRTEPCCLFVAGNKITIIKGLAPE